MQIYEYGKILEAVHTKIENTKQAVRGGTSSPDSFSDILKGYMTVEKSEKKVVSATGNYNKADTPHSINGSTLIYAFQNSGDDTTASAVLNMLGFSDYENTGTSQLKSAADKLTDSAAMLISLNEGDTVNAEAVYAFVTDYNDLVTKLSAESNSSAYLYRRVLSTALESASTPLAEAGVTQDGGYISFSGTGGKLPDDFLTGVVSAASAVALYASYVTSEKTAEDNGISSYYATLMNTMM